MTYLKQYEYVSTIARCGGISQAAEALGLTQPTLSKHLKKIEEEVELLLFDRSATPLKLTQAGELFLESRLKMADLDRQFQKRIDEIKASENAVIRIGIGPSRSDYMMPPIIKRFSDAKPDTRIIIEEHPAAKLNANLASGKLDLIISVLDEGTEAFERIALMDEQLLLAVPAASFPTSQTVEDVLRSIPLIGLLQSLALGQTAKALAEHLGVKAPRIECQSIESAFSLVQNGLGATLVPSYVADFQEENGKVRFLTLDDVAFSFLSAAKKRSVCLFYRKDQFLTNTEKSFIACLKKLYGTKNSAH